MLALPFRLPLIGSVKVFEPVQVFVAPSRLELLVVMSDMKAICCDVLVLSRNSRCVSPVVNHKSPGLSVVGEVAAPGTFKEA